MEWYLKVLKQYADFSGRARRTEFWMFVLFNVIVNIVLSVLALVPGVGKVFYVLSLIYSLAILVPSLAVAVRRLHDIGRSGWFYFINLIPLVGTIIWLVWACTDSQPGANKWGNNPKEASASAAFDNL